MGKINSANEILRNEGLSNLVNAILGFTKVRIYKNIFRSNSIFANWSDLKDRFKGERVFLLGNGPSLNKTPLYLLKNEYTMAFNRINLLFERLSWKPTFYTIADERVAHDIKDEINKFTNDMNYVFMPDIHPRGYTFKNHFIDKKQIYWLDTYGKGFYKTLPKVGINRTVANVGIQILAFLGFDRIYLLGVDMNYETPKKTEKKDGRDWTSISDNDINHFDPRYFGKGKKYHNPLRIPDIMPKTKEFTDSIDLDVFNAGYGGKLVVFPRVDFMSLFNFTPEEQLQLLIDGIESKVSEKISLDKMFADSCIQDDISLWNSSKEYLIFSEAVGVKLIKDAIFTHIPYGPYKGKYYFIKRN